jgi:Family of unknown function (DUF5681)
MPREKRRDYGVGYGKPPHRTRFQKGQSGNPRGRPCESKNLKTLLSEALNEPVVITENGRRRKITKRQAIIRQVVNCSATPDWRGVKIVFDLLRDIEGQSEPASPETSAFTAADKEVVEQLQARLLRKKEERDE